MQNDSARVTACVRQTDAGRILCLSDGRTDVRAALDFGIRVTHLSLCGMENLMYRQPDDRSDGVTTKQGWRLYGGHRFWLAPESADSYFPDNAPIRYTLLPDGAALHQEPDPWLGVRKSLELHFDPDGHVRVRHIAENCADTPRACALWGINTLAGGEAEIAFSRAPGSDYNPDRVLSLWGETSLGDRRLSFAPARICASFIPGVEDYFKLGAWSRDGQMCVRNLGQQLTIRFGAETGLSYPDRGCNAELFLSAHFMELETLGPTVTLQPGARTSHEEVWALSML